MNAQYKCNGKTFDTLREAKRYRDSVVGGREDVVLTIFKKEVINKLEPETVSNVMWVPYR